MENTDISIADAKYTNYYDQEFETEAKIKIETEESNPFDKLNSNSFSLGKIKTENDEAIKEDLKFTAVFIKEERDLGPLQNHEIDECISLESAESGTPGKIENNSSPIEKRFACNRCDYKSARKYTLQRHLLTHTGEKPFSCNLCDFKSITKWYLRLHMISHTGEKRFSCTKCNYKSNSSTELKTHLRTHTGEKPFVCHICDFKCNVKYYLKDHMKTHTSENPFFCPICNYKCKNNRILKKHIKKHSYM